ncbi:hypothetical protein [Nonomuraea longicatena]|uniref:Uncharacterized protein n=1 Tax=Nonomuraea longicatena TaxID=83682 RepID=A0ABN1R5W3_9ACTN
MKEFQFIDEVMPDVPPASPAQVAAVRARVLDRAGPTVARARPARGLMTALLAAAAVVLVITVALVAVSRPSEEPVATPVAKALHAAADRLAAQPPPEGRYWRLETQEIMRTKAATGDYPVEERADEVLIIGRDGRRYTWYEAVSTKPYGAAAKRAWRQAGSPKLCPARGCDTNRRFNARRQLDQVLNLADGLNLTLNELLELPQEPAALRARLLKSYPADLELSREGWLTRVGIRLVTQTPATPGTRAAGYRMLAGLPGISVAGGRDVTGRPGVVVQFPPPKGVVWTQLVIDGHSGEPLAVQQVAPVPGISEKTVWQATVIGKRYWTDVRPVVPPGCGAGCTGTY